MGALTLLVVGILSAAEPPAPAPLPDLAGLARLDAPGAVAGAAPVADAQGALYVVDLAAESAAVFVLPAGPRTVRELSVEPTAVTADAWRTARLRLTWQGDDPAGAGVDLPLGLMFGQGPKPVQAGADRPVGVEGSSWVNRLPMPYRNQALLQVDTARPLVGRIRLRTTPGVGRDAGFLRATSGREQPGGTGRGHVVGILAEPGVRGGITFDGGPVEALSSDESAAWRTVGPRAFRESWAWERSEGDRKPSRPAVVFWYAERPGPSSARAK